MTQSLFGREEYKQMLRIEWEECDNMALHLVFFTNLY